MYMYTVIRIFLKNKLLGRNPQSLSVWRGFVNRVPAANINQGARGDKAEKRTINSAQPNKLEFFRI